MLKARIERREKLSKKYGETQGRQVSLFATATSRKISLSVICKVRSPVYLL